MRASLTKAVRLQRVAWACACAAVACALALVTASAVMPGEAQAARGESYDYTIRVFGGNQGEVSAQMAESHVAYGEGFTLDKEAVSVLDDKYYVKGFRLSGQDGLYQESFTVTRDMDFVVAYGVKGDVVSYTLNFVEYQTGKVLADPVTYYGNKGDKPMVPYVYIDGYRPRYRNITGTLGDEGTNSWTFEYIAVSQDEQMGPGSGEDANSNANDDANSDRSSTSAPGTGAANAPGQGASGAGTAGAAADAGAGGAQGAEGAQGAADEATEPPTEEILDVDNPLAGSLGDDAGPSQDDGTSLPIVLAIVAVAAVGGVAIGLRVRRKARSHDQ